MSEWRRIRGNFAHETEKAYLIYDDCLKEEVWYPKSQISNILRRKERIFFNCPEWLFIKKLPKALSEENKTDKEIKLGRRPPYISSYDEYDEYDLWGDDADEIFGPYFDQC